MSISMTSVSGMTKPDNLLTGFILLLIVERRSGTLTIIQISQFVCLMKLVEVAFIIAVWKVS